MVDGRLRLDHRVFGAGGGMEVFFRRYFIQIKFRGGYLYKNHPKTQKNTINKLHINC
jgi:hypothetical protein